VTCPTQFGEVRQHIVGAFGSLDRHDPQARNNRRLPDLERSCRAQICKAMRDIGAIARTGFARSDSTTGHEDLRRELLRPNNAKPAFFENAGDTRKEFAVPSPKKSRQARKEPDGLEVGPHLRQRRPDERTDERHLGTSLGAGQPREPPNLPELDPMVRIGCDTLWVGRPAQRK
jgi:hypothetical protein